MQNKALQVSWLIQLNITMKMNMNMNMTTVSHLQRHYQLCQRQVHDSASVSASRVMLFIMLYKVWPSFEDVAFKPTAGFSALTPFEIHDRLILPKAITAASLLFQSSFSIFAKLKSTTNGRTSSSQHWASNIRHTPAALHGFQSSSSSNSSCTIFIKIVKCLGSSGQPIIWWQVALTHISSFPFFFLFLRFCYPGPSCSKSRQIYPADKSLSSGISILQLNFFINLSNSGCIN